MQFTLAAANPNSAEVPVTIPYFVVREFRFVGNTVFSSGRLSTITDPLVGHPITVLELEQARIAITMLYVNEGYINSGALIEGPPAADGTVEVRVVEGALTEIRIHGNRWNRAEFYQARLENLEHQPLRMGDIRERLQTWRDVYPLEQVNGEIRPGASPGEAILDVNVRERFPYQVGLQYANNQPPPTGSEQVSALFRADSLARRGDQLTVDYGIARGQSPGMREAQWLGIDDVATAYQIPVTPSDTTVGIQYARSSSSIIEARFAELNISSEYEVSGISLAQPLIRRPGRDLILSLTAEHKHSQSYLLGEPYSFARGAVDGDSTISALRLGAQFVDRDAQQVFAARVALNVGLDVWDATQHAIGPDGRFVSVLAQGRYVRRLGDTDHELVLRVFGQYSPDPLLSLEQVALGGASTVRGYRENTLVRDSAVFGALEFHLTLLRSREGNPLVRIVPFASIGAGWDNPYLPDSPIAIVSAEPFNSISSAGVGLVVTPWRHFEGSVFWGYPFRKIVYAEKNLQDVGINFQMIAWAF